ITPRRPFATAPQPHALLRPGRRARDHDGHPGDPQPDPGEQDRADVLVDPDSAPAADAYARPEPAGAGAAQRGVAGRSARQGRQQRQLRGVVGPGPTAGENMEREQATKFIYDLLRALTARRGSDLFITS